MKRLIVSVFILAALVAVAIGAQADRSGVLFYAGFDDTATAVAAGDGVARGDCGALQFRPGKRGQALLSGDVVGNVSYAVKTNLRCDRGSIEMWICPQDWNGSDQMFHIFFEAKEPGWLMIYKHLMPGKGLFLVGESAEKCDTIGQDISLWKPGEWHHLVASWDRHEARFYMDGKPSARMKEPRLPKDLSKRFVVGDSTWSTGRNVRTLVDELYIYDRPLAEKEVEWAYQQASNRPAGGDIPIEITPAFKTGVRPYPSQGKIVVDVEVSGRRVGAKMTGIARFEPSAGTLPSPVKMVNGQAGEAVIYFKDLPKADYQVLVTMKDANGVAVGTTSDLLRSPGSAVWRGNKIGISEIPPAPWIPVKIAGFKNSTLVRGAIPSISVWGRTYMLGPLGLPVQITSAGEQLLAAPVALQMNARGKPIIWQAKEIVLLSKSDVQVCLKGYATSELGTLHWACTVEYDGMLRYDISLQPSANAVADRMELRVPMKPERSTLNFMELGYPMRTLRGATPSGQGVVYQANFAVEWWLGDEERGLAGFCESDEAWDRADRGDGFRLERTASSVDAVWAFSDNLRKLDKTWKFTFGFESTPVKDAVGWRKWRLTNGANANLDIQWNDNKLMPYFGYPKALDVKKYKALVGAAHAKGLKVIPYSNLLGLGANSPEWSLYREEWKNGGLDTSSADVLSFENTAFMGCTPTKDYIDFMVWANDEYVRSMDFDGIYNDWTWVWESGNQLAGCGYIRDGVVRPTHPIFATRELYKRTYTMLKDYGKEKDKEMHRMGHVSQFMLIPILGFCDSYLDGETYQGIVKDNYLDCISLDQWRAEFMGRNWGVMPFFMPEFTGNSVSQPGPTEHLMGLALLHDFAIWPNHWFCNPDEANRIYRVLDEFGMVDAQLLPYWNNSDVVGGQTDLVKVSAYRKPEGGSLICIVNLTRQPQSVTLSVDWDRLKSAENLTVVDAFTKALVKVQGKSVTVDIAPLSFHLLWVK